ncbi:MAG TPA: CerR family C-terminal domain-containing protein [Solirubrobacteraceae bacterium]|nr:CerR family C-terminal domain-containing protein [Solirubrobacteraceae bacterium]
MNASAAHTLTRAEHGAVTRERLLDAAEELFASNGFAGTSIREITSAAACNLAAVNYHFGGKSRLYREVFRRRLAVLREQRVGSVRRFLAHGRARPALEKVLSEFARVFLEPLVEKDRGRLLIELWAREMLDPQLPPGTFEEEIVEPVQQVLAEAIAAAIPSISAATARLCVVSVVSQLVQVAQRARWAELTEAPDSGASQLARRASFGALLRGRRPGLQTGIQVIAPIHASPDTARRPPRARRQGGDSPMRTWKVRIGARRTAVHAVAGGVLACCIGAGTAVGWPPTPLPAGPNQEVPLPLETPRPAAAPVIPADLVKPGVTITLAKVVDIALLNNPATRASYLAARSAADQLGSKRAAYYPSVDLAASFSRSENTSTNTLVNAPQNIYGPEVTLSYLLLDLGGRAANVEDARLGLLAADWSHNATIQNVVLGVETAYVDYLDAKAQLEAAQVTLKQAQTALDAATLRHDAGLATIAEVLQAKTAFSQAELSRQSADGAVLALRGALATAMGLPANTPYDVGTLPAEVPLERAGGVVEELIANAETRRPDLAAARALADKATAHARAVRSDGLPNLSLNAIAGRDYISPYAGSSPVNAWSATAVVSFPLFTGFANTFDLRKAREDAGVAQAQADLLEQQVILQVWQSYYALQTATQLVKTSRDLLASAEESERVALGRYKEGVGTILDLLTAQAALASARAQEIQARSGWYVALAQLAHDTGAAAPLDQPVEITKKGATP